MDFPAFHLDWAGNRLLFAVIAVTHVLINHSLAVGAMPVVTLLAWRGYRTGDQRWDRLAYRVLAVCFIVTTTLGALTGVGIWLCASLVNPAAIGSLIRVFFWAWFTEWIVFVTEVGLILFFFLTWHRWDNRKRMRVGIGLAISLTSWLTMVIIVAILGFMMDTGHWPRPAGLASGVLNPIYLPQLMFRTPFAMAMAGLFTLFLIGFFVPRKGAGETAAPQTEAAGAGTAAWSGDGGSFRDQAVRLVALWTLGWSVPCLLGAFIYREVVPEAMAANLQVALATQAYVDWYGTLVWLIVVAGGVVLLTAAWGVFRPRLLPRPALILPFVLGAILLGSFERVREFIRKPSVIKGYMYANGLRPEVYPLLKEEGLLTHATYSPVREVTAENKVDAGRCMFNLACTRCHTVNGVNGIVRRLKILYGDKPWNPQTIRAYMAGMHNVRPFMPPVPGSEKEAEALSEYLAWLQTNEDWLPGAQREGVGSR